MDNTYLEFEQEALAVQQRITQLRKEGEAQGDKGSERLNRELLRLHIKEKRILRQLYRNLTPWQRTLVARHPRRPHAKAYVSNLLTDFVPLAGDRCFAEDPAMVAGLANFGALRVAVLGIEKGSTTQERVKYNFGMPKPEGYRKAERVMRMAQRFGLPLITFVDTPGAFPGVEAEARGQAEAIASCLETLLAIDVPVVTVITGEGGSGGALAISVADRVLMLENSVYSVISPEGCASILWRDSKSAPDAADALKLTAPHLQGLKVIDGVIKEPVGGAHRDQGLTFRRVHKALEEQFESLRRQTNSGPRRYQRREKFLAMGAVG